jgi:hypothetical protein
MRASALHIESLEARRLLYDPAPTITAVTPDVTEAAYVSVHVNRASDDSLPLNVYLETKDPNGQVTRTSLEIVADDVGFFATAAAGSTYQIRLQGEWLDGLGDFTPWTDVNTVVPPPGELSIDGDISQLTAHWLSGGDISSNPLDHQFVEWVNNGVTVEGDSTLGDQNGWWHSPVEHAGEWHFIVENAYQNPFTHEYVFSMQMTSPSTFVEPIQVANFGANPDGIALGGNNGVTPCLSFSWNRDSSFTDTQHFTLYKQKSGGPLLTVASGNDINRLTDTNLTGGVWTYSLVETFYDAAGNAHQMTPVTTSVTLNQLTVTQSSVTTVGTISDIHFVLSGALPGSANLELDAQSNVGALLTTSYTTEGTNGLFCTFLANQAVTGAQVELRLCSGFTFVNAIVQVY